MNHSTPKKLGFSLIELVLIILIIGTLGAVAAPKFLDINAQARQVALENFAAKLTAASVSNFAAAKAGSPLAQRFTNLSSCSNSVVFDKLLHGGSGAIPKSYNFTAAANESEDCTAAGGRSFVNCLAYDTEVEAGKKISAKFTVFCHNPSALP